MKKVLIACFLSLFSVFGFCGCSASTTDSNVVRIHIRANSNSECDQEVKLLVRDKVINFITPKIANCSNSEEVKEVLSNNLTQLESLSNQVLSANGYDYTSNAEIRNEYFPSRDYDGEVFPADYYDSLIIELGSGKGNNWWCVAYPPLCFVGEDMEGNKIQYKSKLLELIDKYFGR